MTKSQILRSLYLFTGLLFSINFGAMAANGSVFTDEQSDPKTLGLMQGFPPAIDKRVMLPDSNFFSFPNLRWSVCYMRELLPTAPIYRSVSGYQPLAYALLDGIDEITFSPTNQTSTMSWQDSLAANYTDGILIMHRSKIVYEKYRGCLSEHVNHAAMSMTKSITGLVAEILIAQDVLDDTLLVKSIIPELEKSAFGDATVRQVMDMTTALQYSENYADPNADVWKYTAAANPLPKPAEYDGPVGYFEYLQTVKKEGQHGVSFGYKTINTDTLGWIISRVTGEKFNQVVSKVLWSPLGMEMSADITVDGLGIPFSGGGMSATLRDLARLGLAISNDGIVNGIQIIPKAAIENIRKGGDKEAFSKAGYTSIPNGSYRSMWWHFHNDNSAFAARGVHGQTIYIDPVAEMVIVRFASHPTASNSAIDPTSLPAYQAVAEYLMSNVSK